MPVYIVLLRGVNVGKAKRVPMAEFREVLLDLGCTRATTLLNSGNAIVEHPKTTSRALGTKVAAALAGRFGFDVPVIAKSAAELETVVSGNELTVVESDYPRFLVAFASSSAALEGLKSLAGLMTSREQFLLTKHAGYLYCADGILESKAATALLGRLGKDVTTRNWATVLKIHAMVRQTPSTFADRTI